MGFSQPFPPIQTKKVESLRNCWEKKSQKDRQNEVLLQFALCLHLRGGGHGLNTALS